MLEMKLDNKTETYPRLRTVRILFKGFMHFIIEKNHSTNGFNLSCF